MAVIEDRFQANRSCIWIDSVIDDGERSAHRLGFFLVWGRFDDEFAPRILLRNLAQITLGNAERYENRRDLIDDDEGIVIVCLH